MPHAFQLKRNEIQTWMNLVFEDDLHAKRVESLANATLGVLTSASLAVHAIGQGLAYARGLMTKHAVKQVDRLLSNAAIDVWTLFERWVPYVIGARKKIRVALDWTEFDRDGHSTLALNLLTRHGRATPLLWMTVRKAELKDQRNAHEDALLCRLREVLPPEVEVTVIADRGFCDTKLLNLLEHELGFGYVIRLRSNIWVTSKGGECRQARDWVGAGGKARTLRGATVTAEGYPVATVVCLQDKAMQEPWCLVASDPKAGSRELAKLYGQRWGIETWFRDTKTLRFGLGMSAIRTRDTARRDRLFLLAALAVVLMTLLGAAGESLGYDRMLKSNTVKRRTHSLFRQGWMLYELIPNMPAERLKPLMQRFAEMLQEQRLFTDIFGIV